MVEQIQLAVNGYYGQFEESVEEPAAAETARKPRDCRECGRGLEAPLTEEPAAERDGARQCSAENESVTIENTEQSGSRVSFRMEERSNRQPSLALKLCAGASPYE